MGQIHHIRKRKEGKHLEYKERQLIEYLVNKRKKKRISVTKLKETIGCSESTIRRELKRGSIVLRTSTWEEYESYDADKAQRHYDYQATNKGPNLKILKDYDFVEYVEKKIIEDKYSPDAVIMKLEQNGFINPKTGRKFKTQICTKTLYNYIDKEIFPNLTNKSLPREGRRPKRKQRRVRKALKNRGGTSIWERPEAANKRSELGHWEMDCIEGPKGKDGACLLTMVERKSRKSLIFKIKDQTQDSVINILNRLERKFGRVKFSKTFKTITVDNGSEFLNHQEMERSLRSKTKKRTKIYYCHPYSSWERGSNEQTNGMIRRFIPKGNKISTIANKDILQIEEWLNNYPRRIFDGKSSKQKEEAMKKKKKVLL